ncbi:MAG: 50S ribosomal protein L18 [Pirellulales bacterium]|nr:50S ribosomal protein L18 [Pirellulales bacterium]
MDHNKALGKQRRRRCFRVRKRLRGTAERPRLCITRSHRNILAQVIDDISGTTIASASTRDKALAKKVKYGGNAGAAELVGQTIAQRATKAGVGQVSFDRGSSKYHGRVAALANAAREAGLQF